MGDSVNNSSAIQFYKHIGMPYLQTGGMFEIKK